MRLLLRIGLRHEPWCFGEPRAGRARLTKHVARPFRGRAERSFLITEG